MNAIDTFFEMSEKISISVPFNTIWDNGTGYYVIKKMPVLSAGDCVKAVNDDGRKLIIFGTDYGTAVVFQRDGEGHRQSRVCCNFPDEYASELHRSWTGEVSNSELDKIAAYLGL